RSRPPWPRRSAAPPPRARCSASPPIPRRCPSTSGVPWPSPPLPAPSSRAPTSPTTPSACARRPARPSSPPATGGTCSSAARCPRCSSPRPTTAPPAPRSPPPCRSSPPAGGTPGRRADMCGIFGAVSLAGAPLRHPDRLAAMAASLAHRGPDGEQIVGHERARLGARRLAIMDLTTGDQPFQNPDRSIWMVCNGEIYNAPALRREAARAGYPFRSTGDIETIVPLYERWGPEAVSRLEGMFALAVWDDGRGRLVLARDRAGEKPLFWTLVAGELRFASEVQALLVFP